MKQLTFNELQQVNGGSGPVYTSIFIGIAAFISFVSGFLSGFTNPHKCND
jgi:lactobin A/cerein 7B family class IIb bacteriocin